MQETALDKAHRINRKNREAGIKVEKEYNLMKKDKANPKSLRATLDAMCFHCVGGTIDSMPDPGWQKSIGECTAPDCPQHPQRPYTKKSIKTKSKSEDRDVKKRGKPRQLNLPRVEH